MNPVLREQLALDYCCAPEEAEDGRNHFCVFSPQPGRRRFQEDLPCHLKAAVVNGKLLFTGEEDILRWCRARYGDEGGAWFLEAENLRVLERRLGEDGYRIRSAHPFFLGEGGTEAPPVPAELTLRWFEGPEIEAFRGDGRFDEAFAFCPQAPDLLGLAALRDGEFLGMAGASCDSPLMWQIGINVEPAARGRGLGTLLVCRLKNELLRRGVLPFYGTSPSHLASQRVALGAGFVPAWAELITARDAGDGIE